MTDKESEVADRLYLMELAARGWKSWDYPPWQRPERERLWGQCVRAAELIADARKERGNQ